MNAITKYIIGILVVFGVFILVDQMFPPNNNDVKHFSNSMDLANKATGVSNAGGAFEQISEDDIEQMIEYYKQALEEAQQVDVAKLNRDYTNFGDHYRDEFMKGMELFVEGLGQSDQEMSLNGQVLLDRWGTWFSDNIDEIRKL